MILTLTRQFSNLEVLFCMIFCFVTVVYAGNDDVCEESLEFLEFRFLEMKFDD